MRNFSLTSGRGLRFEDLQLDGECLRVYKDGKPGGNEYIEGVAEGSLIMYKGQLISPADFAKEGGCKVDRSTNVAKLICFAATGTTLHDRVMQTPDEHKTQQKKLQDKLQRLGMTDMESQEAYFKAGSTV